MDMISRRHLLAAGALALPFYGLAGASKASASLPRSRKQLILEHRRNTDEARQRFVPTINGDEERYPDRRGSFSKTMPHDDLGEVDPDAYRKWLAIVASGDFAAFESVPRAAGAVERLNNPQATYATDLLGIDSAALSLAPPPLSRPRAVSPMPPA